MSVTSVRFQTDVEKSLTEAAERLQRSKNWIVNLAVKEYISRSLEEESRWQDTLIALDSVKRGEIVDGKEVHSWLESWGSAQELDKPSK